MGLPLSGDRNSLSNYTISEVTIAIGSGSGDESAGILIPVSSPDKLQVGVLEPAALLGTAVLAPGVGICTKLSLECRQHRGL